MLSSVDEIKRLKIFMEHTNDWNETKTTTKLGHSDRNILKIYKIKFIDFVERSENAEAERIKIESHQFVLSKLLHWYNQSNWLEL